MRPQQPLIGESDHFLFVIDHVSRIAPLNRPVLILGERGTGKELIAKRLHYLSRRWDGPLISLNCAALSEGLIDSELFGHEAGSFSGAKGRHKGRFERAEGGTLFLDEVASSPLRVQEKLLRVIEYGEYERVGGDNILNTNVRVICATNENLPQLANEGRFRADLLDRLAFDVIHLPPLRERSCDIVLLAEYYALKMCHELDYQLFSGFTQNALNTLNAYHWPGNVRELKNVVERAIYRHGDENSPVNRIHLDPFTVPWTAQIAHENTPLPTASIPSHPSQKYTFPIDLRRWQQQQEKEIVEFAITQSKFNQRRAAELLGLSYHQIRGLLRKYNVVGEEDTL